MKHYPKIYSDLCDISKWSNINGRIKSVDGSLDELILKFRNFYKETHLSIFESTIKEIWLEKQLVMDGRRRIKRRGNGVWSDILFSRFNKVAVGTSHRVLTANFCFTPVATYLIDFFPDFLYHDPFKEPEEYKYPYKKITLDYLVFVYQMDERLELLEEAEKRGMSYAEFINWATNWALCYNDDNNVNKYQLIGGHLNWPYIRNNKLKRWWEHKKFNFK
jgi:hypothetical protein